MSFATLALINWRCVLIGDEFFLQDILGLHASPLCNERWRKSPFKRKWSALQFVDPASEHEREMMKLHLSLRTAIAGSVMTLTPFVYANPTMVATGSAPRTSEIQWINLDGYEPEQALSPAAGQSNSHTLPGGLTLTFVLKQTNSAPDVPPNSVNYGLAALPASTQASFGNVGYTGLTGKPIIYGRHSGKVEVFNIELKDSNGLPRPFEWIVADAETTGWNFTVNREEFVSYETNGEPWDLITNLLRVGPNESTLDSLQEVEYASSGLIATVQSNRQTGVNPDTNEQIREGGAMVFSSLNPTSITFSHGASNAGGPGSATPYSRQAVAFGIALLPTADMQASGPSTVPSVPGATVKVTTFCTNAGPDVAENVRCDVSGAPPNASAQTVCTPAVPASDLAVGAAIRCETTLTPTGTTPITLTTSAGSDTFDPNANNNTATTTLRSSLAVPVDAPWMLMLLGLVLGGFAWRHKQRG